MNLNRYFHQLSGLFLILMVVLVISGCSTIIRSNGSSKPNVTVEMTSTVVIDDANNGHGNNMDGCDESNPGNGASCTGTATPVITDNNGQGKK